MEGGYQSISRWRVRPEADEEFRHVFRENLGSHLRAADRTAVYFLMQSMEDRSLYYSVATWETLEEFQKARGAEQIVEAFDRLMALCEETDHDVAEIVAIVPHPG